MKEDEIFIDVSNMFHAEFLGLCAKCHRPSFHDSLVIMMKSCDCHAVDLTALESRV
jgi:hypothetical protein